MEFTNVISKQVWEDRYKKEQDTNLADNFKRVAKYCTKNKDDEKELFDLLNRGLFYFAGRTMSNAGIGKDLTLSNCFCLNSVPDSIEGIFEYVKYGAMTQKSGGGQQASL